MCLLETQQRLPSKAGGKVCFSQKGGKQGTMKDFYYVSDLKNNIISMGQLLEKGYSVFMKDRILHLKDKNGRVLANVERTNVQTQLKEYLV